MKHNEHYARMHAIGHAVDIQKAIAAGGGHVTNADLISTAEAIFDFFGSPDDINDDDDDVTKTQPIAPEDDIGF